MSALPVMGLHTWRKGELKIIFNTKVVWDIFFIMEKLLEIVKWDNQQYFSTGAVLVSFVSAFTSLGFYKNITGWKFAKAG